MLKEQTYKINAGLLVLRIAAGLSLFALFGLNKLKSGADYFFVSHQWSFVDFNRNIGLPLPVLSAVVQTLNESVCALLVAIGFFTRISALLLAIGFTVAVCSSLKAHEDILIPGLYASMFVALALTGPGKFSIDSIIRRKRS
ncbi:MAG TPA: DoxX family protein [Blastocatellia bacterium]|nr:DoxX family protein [Blastocatellia bacterium]